MTIGSPMRLVVCGTDTDVGKTVVSALLVQGLGAHYWKPVQSGCIDGSDREWIQALLQLPEQRICPESYRLRAPVSPHWAAEQEGLRIEAGQLQLPQVAGALVVETAGGLLVPLRRDWLQIDQLVDWRLPVLLVARSGLGTLNHTLLSVEALRSRRIPLLGIVLNGPPHPDNPRTLAQLTAVPVLAQLPPLAPLTAQALANQWHGQGLSHTLAKAFAALAKDP